MRRNRAALGSAIFFLLAPGSAAGLIPWWLTGWRLGDSPLAARVLGVVMIVAGVAVLASSFVFFAVVGRGTPAPVAPPQHLVVRGAYRYVRNPMYVAVISIIVGQALLLGSARLLWYALAFWVVTALFVRFYEEPNLRRTFGEEYQRYRRHVRAWIPRVRPWHPDGTTAPARPGTSSPVRQ